MNCRYCNEPEHPGRNCDREALKHAIDMLHLQIEAQRKIGEPGVVMITSLVSHKTRKPRIDIQLGKLHTQMDTESAMDVAKNIIEVCAGSYADAFLVHFLGQKLDVPMEVIGQILPEFRQYREQLRQEFDQMQKEKMIHDDKKENE